MIPRNGFRSTPAQSGGCLDGTSSKVFRGGGGARHRVRGPHEPGRDVVLARGPQRRISGSGRQVLEGRIDGRSQRPAVMQPVQYPGPPSVVGRVLEEGPRTRGHVLVGFPDAVEIHLQDEELRRFDRLRMRATYLQDRQGSGDGLAGVRTGGRGLPQGTVRRGTRTLGGGVVLHDAPLRSEVRVARHQWHFAADDALTGHARQHAGRNDDPSDRTRSCRHSTSPFRHSMFHDAP